MRACDETGEWLGSKVLSDRVSRKKLILASSIAISASAWLMTLVPSVEIYIFTKAARVSILASQSLDQVQMLPCPNRYADQFQSSQLAVCGEVLALVSDIGGPIRDAMLRDIFSADEWELSNGGVTGLRARLAVVGQMGFAFAMAVGSLGNLLLCMPGTADMRQAKLPAQDGCDEVGRCWHGATQ